MQGQEDTSILFPITPYHRVGFAFGDNWTVNADGGPFLCGYPENHTGWDVRRNPSGAAAMEAGDPVYARYDGIIYNHTQDPRWGNGVVIEHDPIPGVLHWGTCLWHVDHLLPDGAYVKEGEQVATIYNLGPNTHLHDSVWVGVIDDLTRRGALPHVDCNGVPAFPAGFVDPYRFTLDHQQEEVDLTKDEHDALMAAVADLTKLVQNLIEDKAVDTAAGHQEGVVRQLLKYQQQDRADVASATGRDYSKAVIDAMAAAGVKK